MCHDMIEVEKMGKPAVPLVSGRFEDDAIASSRTFGMPDLQFVIVPRIYRNLADDLCVSQTEDVIDDLIATGGTAMAAAKLVEKSGGKIESFVFVINLFDLGGKDLLEKNSYKSLVLVNFPGH